MSRIPFFIATLRKLGFEAQWNGKSVVTTGDEIAERLSAVLDLGMRGGNVIFVSVEQEVNAGGLVVHQM